MNETVSTATAVTSRRPHAGTAVAIALAVGLLIAGAAYAARTGAFTLSDPALGASANARTMLAHTTGVTHARHHARLLAWHAPRVPKVRAHSPTVITPPPRVVTITAPAPAPQPVATPAPAPAPAPTGENDNGGSDG
jgi:hypothetical protein